MDPTSDPTSDTKGERGDDMNVGYGGKKEKGKFCEGKQRVDDG